MAGLSTGCVFQQQLQCDRENPGPVIRVPRRQSPIGQLPHLCRVRGRALTGDTAGRLSVTKNIQHETFQLMIIHTFFTFPIIR